MRSRRRLHWRWHLGEQNGSESLRYGVAAESLWRQATSEAGFHCAVSHLPSKNHRAFHNKVWSLLLVSLFLNPLDVNSLTTQRVFGQWCNLTRVCVLIPLLPVVSCFSYNCINLHLAEHRFCPMQGCGHSPITRDDIFPNFLLNKVVTSGISLPGEQGGARESVTQITESLLQEGDQLSVNDVDSLIATLLEKRRTMQNETHLQDLQVCSDFLHRARRQRELRKEQLELEMSVIDGDLERLKQAAASNGKAARRNPSPRVGGVRDIDGATKGKEPASAMKRKRGGEEHQLLARVQSGDLNTESIFTEARTPATDAQTASEALSEKTRRVCSHFDDLQDAYFESHQVHQGAPGTALRRFQHSLFKFTRYSAFKIFSELKCGSVTTRSKQPSHR